MVAELEREPAADDRAEDPDHGGRQAPANTSRPDEPARNRADDDPEDDPADEVEQSHAERVARAGERRRRVAVRDLPVSQQASILGPVKVTIDVDSDLYRAIKVEAARADRSVRELIEEALTAWLERAEDDEDRASAIAALEEYRRDGGASAEAWFGRVAAEAKATYGGEKR